MTQQTIFSSTGVDVAEVGIWVKKDKKGIIYYAGDEKKSNKRLEGKGKTIQEVIEKILEELKCKKAKWLIRMNSSENQKEWTKEEVDYIKTLDRFGCIADDYELCGERNSDNPNFLYEEFDIGIKSEEKKPLIEEKDYAVYYLNYFKNVSVDGTIKEYLSMSSTVEFRQHLGSSYCSGGSYSTDKELKELYDSILSFFKNQFDTPFVEFGKFDENWYGFYVSDIKAENIKLSISKEGIEFLKRRNFPLDELMNKIEEMRKNRTQLTKEYLDRIEMYKDLEEFVESTEEQIRDLVDAIIEKGKTFKSVLDIKKLWDKVNDLTEQLKDIDSEYSKLHIFFFGWDRHSVVMEKNESWWWKRYETAKEVVFNDKMQ